MRKFGKTDANQAAIIEALREIDGCDAVSTASLGDRFPGDIMVGYRGSNLCFEIKNPEYPNAHKERRERQARFRDRWPGQCAIVSGIAEIIEAMTGGFRDRD